MHRRGTTLLFLLVFSTACGEAQSKKAASTPARRDFVRVGTFVDKRLEEASGVVRSTREPGVFWSQNDRGNKAMLFAYDSTGASRGTVIVDGAENTDWEALAVGPCPSGSCVYVGDVGDNFAARPFVTVLRMPEPLASLARSNSPERVKIAYPEGATDVEAMWVAPDTSIWFATKRPRADSARRIGRSRVYRVPPGAWGSDRVVVAQLIDSLPIVPGATDSRNWITDAALSTVRANGRRELVILTYGSVYVFDADPVTGRPAAQLSRCAVPAKEKNAEGVTWLADGRLLLVNEGRGSRLYTGRCP